MKAFVSHQRDQRFMVSFYGKLFAKDVAGEFFACCMLSFNGLRSTQMHIVPAFLVQPPYLCTKTLVPPPLQSLALIPFCLTLVSPWYAMEWEHDRGLKIVNGLAPAFSLIEYFSPKLPKP